MKTRNRRRALALAVAAAAFANSVTISTINPFNVWDVQHTAETPTLTSGNLARQDVAGTEANQELGIALRWCLRECS